MANELVRTLRAAGCVYAEDEAELILAAAASAAELADLVARRCSGEPLEQVLGWAGFCGLRIQLEPGVFVPRRRTELLVEQAVSLAPPRPLVVDLCCGSGAVGAAVSAALPGTELYAVDLDPAAVRCARRNAPDALVLEGDLFAPLPDALRGRVDVLTVNAPYVPTDDVALLPPEARLHEPRLALDGGPDGLDVQRAVAAGAAGWLRPGGHLLVETSVRQAARSLALVTGGGLVARVTGSAERDATVVVGRRP